MTPLQTEFYGRIGKTLLRVQQTEAQLQICLSYFLRAGEAKTVEEIEAMAEADRKKTLGNLIEKIRERIVVQEDFNEKLTKFVEDRNALAHRFLKVDGVNLTTDEGLKKGIEFLKSLDAQADEVRKIIQGLMGLIEDAPTGDEEQERYKALAKVIFG
jgi:hypothetical protein